MLLYTLRNLFKAPMRTFQLVLGSFAVLILLFAAFAFESGMEKSLQVSGDPRNVILLGVGSEESVERSEIHLAAVPSVETIPGLKKQFGESAVSPEVHYNTIVSLPSLIDSEETFKETQAMVRGVRPAALSVYSNVVVTEGQFPQSGEILVGRLAGKRMSLSPEELSIGKTIRFEKQDFQISGIFAAPGSVMESELWMNLGDIVALTRRDSISCIVVRLEEAEFSDIDLFCKQRLDLQITAMLESDYYKKLGEFYRPIKIMAWLTAILIAAGAFLGGLNTFYAAASTRCAEFAVLEVIGYSRMRLGLSLFFESLFFHTIAYLLAAFVALKFFSQIHLHFSSSFFHLAIESKELLHLFGVTVGLSIIAIVLPAINILTPHLRESLRD